MRDFEDFLMEKHAEQYISTKDKMIGGFNEWVQDLGADEFIEYGNQALIQIKRGLLEKIEKLKKIEETSYHCFDTSAIKYNQCLSQVKQIIEDLCK